jgi:hypothetical protein
MKYIKEYRIFESNIETIKMECDDILTELRDLGLSIDVKSMHLSHWTIEITIKDDVSKFDDLYKTNVQIPIFDHLFSYLEEENFKNVYDKVESISYTEFIGTNHPLLQQVVEKSERVHTLKFVAK